MNKRLPFISLLFLILTLFSFIPGLIEARSHRFLDLEIEAQVGADGLVRVIESHTIQFQGEFSGMFQRFNTSRGVKISELLVSEEGVPYERIEGTKPGPPGTYYVDEKADEVYVDWSFSARDKVRTFELRYTLANVVLKHEDVAELYYIFVGSDWDEPRDHVKVVLNLPYGAELEQIGAWGHGPLHGQVTIVSPRQIIWEVDSLPPRTFVEGRVVFPPFLVPGATRLTKENALDRILAEEAGKVAKVEKLQKRKKLDPYLATLAFLLGSSIIFYFSRRFGRNGKGYQEKYYQKLPANYPPAELAILYRYAVSHDDLIATILDLARRGFLSIEEISLKGVKKQDKYTYQFSRIMVSPEKGQELRSYENSVLTLLFSELEADVVSLEDFEQYLQKYPENFQKFWQSWSKLVEKSTEKYNFYDLKSRKQAGWFLIPSFACLFLAIGAFVWELNVSGVVLSALFILSLGLIISFAFRRSEQGHLEYTKWKAFRRYLKDFSRVEISRVGSLGIWEEVLPYAMTLGVATQLFDQLAIVFPNLEQNGYHFGSGWLLYSQASGMNRIGAMTTSMQKSFTSTIQSSGSSGGGFSGGGGGGFGGGGGGVR